MSPQEMHIMIQRIKRLPDRLLRRVSKIITHERLNRDLIKLKILYDQRRFP